jgi:hypothetical protein
MYQSTLAYLAKQAYRVKRLTGDGMTGQGPKDRAQLRDPYGLRDFVTDNLKDNQNPMLSFVSELMSGKDSLGRDIDTNQRAELGGAAIDPNVYWLLSKLPGFSSINNSIGGRGAITDPSGNVQAPAQSGLFGTPQREATRTEEARYRAGKFMGDEPYSVIRNFLGLDVRTIDLAEGRQHTLKDVQYTISTLQKKSNELRKMTERTSQQDAQLEVASNQILQLKVDEHRVRTWMQQNNVPEPKALQKMQKDGITVRSLPTNNAQVQRYIDEYMQARQGYTVSTPAK